MGESKKRELSFWSCRRKPIKCGELYETQKQVHELPRVGARVIVHECVIYTETNATGQIVTAYKPSRNYFDVWGFPAVYEVVSYSKGREAALDKSNVIQLERTCKSGYVQRASVNAADVAIGVVLLQEIENEEDANRYKSKQFGYRTAIVRETSADLMKAAIRRKQEVAYGVAM